MADVKSTSDAPAELAEDPMFLLTEAGLNICWQAFLFTFGLSLFGVGAYYLFVYVFRAHVENWCKPGEESAFPLFGFLSSSMRKMGIKSTPESWITLCLVFVLSACIIYAGILVMVLILIVHLAICMNIANWWIGGSAWGECTGSVLDIIGVTK